MGEGRAPAFMLYAKDWRDRKVRRLSLAAQGAYIAILADMWADSDDQCSIPFAPDWLARSLAVDGDAMALLLTEVLDPRDPLLLVEDREGVQYLVSKRLRKEREALSAKRKARSTSGKKGAKARWGRAMAPPSVCHAPAIGLPMAKDGIALSSSSTKELSCPVEATRLALLLAELIRSNNSRRTISEAQIKAWAGPIEKANRIDGFSWDELESFIRWAQASDFWAANILSGEKLRKQLQGKAWLDFGGRDRKKSTRHKVWACPEHPESGHGPHAGTCRCGRAKVRWWAEYTTGGMTKLIEQTKGAGIE
jgi:hypothetical protein